jgi:2,4-dienoyl-CoA reductase-like NADH-dependent reductase (Old Yellow Enzyme family)
MYACEGPAGVVGSFHLAHYGQFALGGAGLIITEATAVAPEGRVTPHDAGLWNDDQVAPWRAVTDFVHSVGGRIAVQLAHAGRKAGHHRGLPGDNQRADSVPLGEGGWQTLGASDEPFGRYADPRTATEEDLADLIAAFATSARRAVDAGFDAVELHGAHGYLLHEFLSPVTNVRNDSWGGTATARSRLLFEVVGAVRAELPDDMPLIVRLSVDDAVDNGTDAAASAELSIALQALGVDLIDCSSGGLVAGADYRPGPGYQVAGSVTVRATGVLTAAVGMITEPIQAETIVATGQADAVLLGREMLRNPHWARRAATELGALDQAPAEPRYHRAYR